jgi:hypothetical protein
MSGDRLYISSYGKMSKNSAELKENERSLTCQAYSSVSLLRLSHSFLSFVAMNKQYRFKSVRSMEAISRSQSSVELDAL